MAGGAGAPVGMVVAVSSRRVVVAKPIDVVQSHWRRRIPVRHMRLYLYFLFELNEAGSGVLISFEHRLPPMMLPQTAEMLPPPPMIDRKLLLRSTYISGSYSKLHTAFYYWHYTRRYLARYCQPSLAGNILSTTCILHSHLAGAAAAG